MKLYKLTDGDGKTRGGTQWGPGVNWSKITNERAVRYE